MSQTSNPLRQFFRQPAVYIKLPSDGQFWPEKSISMTENRELPVLPMTAIDEITYRTPDALFNGQAVISVIQSCIPAIKNAWDMPGMDTNAVLVAIRIASYGHGMGISSTCPACKTEQEYEIDLRSVLDLRNQQLTVMEQSQQINCNLMNNAIFGPYLIQTYQTVRK